MTEEWRDVVGYEGLYQVTRDGLVRNARTGKPLICNAPPGRYRTVMLRKNGISKNFGVHRIVALTFLGEPKVDFFGRTYLVNHKNGDKQDNRLENLEYLSSSDNTSHYHNTIKDKSNWVSPVTIRSERQNEAARKCGFSNVNCLIDAILSGDIIFTKSAGAAQAAQKGSE